MSAAPRGIGRRRRLVDRATTGLVTGAGVGVLATIVLLLTYLLWEVVPLMQSTDISYDRSEPHLGGRLLPGGHGARPASPAEMAVLAGAGLAIPGVTASVVLPGERSVVVATDAGVLEQYGRVRDGPDYRWQRLRRLDSGGLGVRKLMMEPGRQVLFALGAAGELQLWHLTAERKLLDARLPRAGSWQDVAVAADGSTLAVRRGDVVHYWRLRNPHPEVSLTSLWQKVWYQDYPAPRQLWQSAATGANDEPKLSLAPLTVGTFKAALYTMILAAPLAIAAAIYTARFMARPLRAVFKPGIELMEAFPTVVLGFLAGLWLAPRVEDALAGVLLVPLVLLVGLGALALLCLRLPPGLRDFFAPGLLPLLLIPYVIALVGLTLAASDPLESWFFAGDLPAWLGEHLGLAYEQRNALVVGIAMGFAVLPTIFSLAEDAIFSVPRSLSDGSLALGATRLQTLAGVVLPTAAPGILAALMIGFGRAIGETMIVLMASGNTPLMSLDPVSGMRTLSANIVMEAPEAIVGSTHFRVLFLAALLLFAFTFAINTIAEFVRQRLRFRFAAI